MPTPACGSCGHFVAAAEDFEREVPGLKILSSAFGSVRADTGICRLRDFFCVPGHSCPDWQREPAIAPPPA